MPAIYGVEIRGPDGAVKLDVLSQSPLEAAHTLLGNLLGGMNPIESAECLSVEVQRKKQVGGRG